MIGQAPILRESVEVYNWAGEMPAQLGIKLKQKETKQHGIIRIFTDIKGA